MSRDDKTDIVQEGYFDFDPEDPIFKDHFPGNAVVPGSLIIHAFVKALGRKQNSTVSPSIANFRFKRFIQPGRYAFRMESGCDGRVACCLRDGATLVVTGTL